MSIECFTVKQTTFISLSTSVNFMVKTAQKHAISHQKTAKNHQKQAFFHRFSA